MAYEVVPFTPDRRRETIELHALLRGQGIDWSSEYLRWKYEENPYLREPLLYLALADGRVVGMRGVYGTCWRLDGERVVLPCFGDTIIEPAHRNRGVFPLIMRTALADLRHRGYAYAINQSGEPATVLASLATGWKALGRPALLRRRTGRERLARYRKIGRPYRLLRRMSYELHGKPSVFAALDRVAPGARSADALADVLDLPAQAGRLRHVRDAEFLAWRLAQPMLEHCAVDGVGREDGCRILLRAMKGDRRVTVVDWAAPTPRGLAQTVRHAVRRGRLDDVAFWAGTLSGDERRELASVGFVADDPKLRASLLLRATDERPAAEGWRLGSTDLLTPEAWDLRLLHSERDIV